MTTRAAHLACVYRKRNAGLVSELVADATRADVAVRLWALDEEAPELAVWTVGTGPGGRLALLNRLLDGAPPAAPVVVSDDDVRFVHGGLGRLLQIAARGGLDLCQPAHTAQSLATHDITRVHPRSRARLTSFVEVGPMFVVQPSLRPRMLPFPEEFGMGWGLDVVWAAFVREGFRLGIIDEVTIDHTGAIGADYSTETSEALLADALEGRGLPDMSILNNTMARWPSWSPIAPWQLPGGTVLRSVDRFLRRRS
jgi:hypothetical protein